MKRWFRRRRQDSEATTARNPAPPGSANVFSYYARRSKETPASGRQSNLKPRRQKRRFNWRAMPSLIALIVIAGSLGYLFVLDTNPKLVVLGDQQQAALLQDNGTYSQAAEGILKDSVFNRTKLTVNTNAVAGQLKQRFPELETVSITVPLASHRLVIEIEAVTPALLLGSQSAETYVVDTGGRAVVRAQDAPNLSRLNLPSVTDESGLELRPGRQILPTEQIEFIQDITNQLRAKSLSVQSLTLPAQANELYVRVAGERYFAKFYLAGDARLQSGTFLAVRQQLKKDGVNPAEYIDVRVPEKAFYK